MGAVRVMEWTQRSPVTSAQRPSWLSPPLPKPAEGRARLSVVPGPRLASVPPPRLASVPPPSSAGGVNRASVIPMVPGHDLAERDATIRDLSAELETLRTTVAELAATLATSRRNMLEASEGELVKLALVVAERVVGVATTADPTLIAGWARDAIATLPARDAMVVAISSDLAESVPEGTWEIATNGAHRLEVDRTLPRATCEVRAGVASVEVSAAARMAAVGEAIGAIS